MDAFTNGATTVRQLRGCGLGQRAIASRVARGELEHVTSKVLVSGATRDTALRRATVAHLGNCRRTVVTGAYALRRLGHPVGSTRDHVVDMSIPEGARLVHVPGVNLRRSSHHHCLEVLTMDDLPVAAPWWSYGDLARDVDDRTLGRIIAAGVGSRNIAVSHLADGLERRPHFPGAARLRRVVQNLGSDMAFSSTEARAARYLRRHGYPVELNAALRVDGRVIRAGDLVLPDRKASLEIDGPHHWLPEQARLDREQDAILRRDDWRIERVDVYSLDEDESVLLRAMTVLLS